MRVLYPLFIALVVCGCAAGPRAVRATMPLEIWRAEGDAPRMRPARVVVGSTESGAPFQLTIRFDSDDLTLGKVSSVTWQMSLEGYCRDKPTMVRSVLIGPSGQVWPVGQVFVPAGPDRGQNWSSGGFADNYGRPGTQELLDAVSAGGRFTLAIEDDEGQLWNPSLIDTLTPAQRHRLFAANRAVFESTDPESVPVAGETPLIAVYDQPFVAPWPPRPCPETTEPVRAPAPS